MNKYFRLLRVEQWYKNLAVFLALIFSANLLNGSLLLLTLAAFLSLSLISSANYIFNDLRDASADRKHPVKKHRPIAAGTISRIQAWFFAVACLVLGLLAAWLLSFFVVGVLLFLFTTAYTYWLKHVLFADILLIATNFVLRAMAGAFAISVFVSEWLLLGVFFLALFLMLGKRHVDGGTLYSQDLTHPLFSAFLAIVMLAYALYASSSEYLGLLYTLPLFLFLLLRYYHLVLSNSPIAHTFELAFRDKTFLFVGGLFFLMSVVIILW